EVVSKVWHGALELGVMVTEEEGMGTKKKGANGSAEEECIQEIQCKTAAVEFVSSERDV
ncbi:hypothetical protein A2U01_0038466, partial [Trifolium medium]|nr:hypothetical protein [Trifolium medium]